MKLPGKFGSNFFFEYFESLLFRLPNGHLQIPLILPQPPHFMLFKKVQKSVLSYNKIKSNNIRLRMKAS